MGNSSSEDRRSPPAEEFLRRLDAALLAPRRSDEERRARAALRAASHITDEVLLDQLVAFGIRADTLTALSLVPLAEVAWVDGRVEAAEKRAILEAARAAGLDRTSTGHKLLESCLERPQSGLREMWEQYITILCTMLPTGQREALKSELLERVHSVAEAAGGFPGVGTKVSSKEAAVLAEIAAAFDGDPA